MTISKMSIFVYNNGNAKVVIDGKTLYTNKGTAYSFFLFGRNNMKAEYWNITRNREATYIFVKQ